MSTVSIIGIDATWKSSCFPSTVADDADSTARNNRTGVLMVPEIGTGTGIVILDLGRRNPDVNASQIPNMTSTTSQVPEKPSIRARDCRLWERMQATGFPCLVAVMAQPLVEASHRTVKERSSDMEGTSDIGLGAGAVPTPVHHPLSTPTTLSPPPLTALPPSASDQTAKQLLLYMSIDAPPVVSPQDTTCTADHGDVANGVGDYSCSETPAPVAVPSLSHDTSSSYVRGKLCEPLNPGVARGTTATPPMSGLPCPRRSSTLLGTRSQTRALVPLYYGSAPVASLRYLLASTAVRVDAHSTPWASLTAVSTVMREAERTALAEQGDESQQQPTVSTSACTAASTGAVGVAQVVCRAVWPIPPWPANALPEFFPEAFPLLSYSMNTDGDYHDASMTEPSPKKMPGPLSAAADDDDVEAAISDLVEHLGEWNSSLVASMLMSAQVIAVSTSTTQSPSPSLPRKQWETAETKHKTMKGKADTDAADVEKEAGRVTAASAFLTSMPELLALLFQYWHQQRQHQEASTSLHAFAAPTTAAAATASTTTGFAAHEGIGMIRQSPASPPQTPAHISRAFFQDPQGHAYPTEEDWLKSIEHTPEKTTSPSCLTAPPPPPADRHNYTTASFVEQLLMSIEFSIAYLVNRKREAAEAAATGRQARVDALSEVIGGNSVHAPPLTSSQVQQRLQCYRLPCISSRTPFEVVWGLYLAQRMRMLCDPATLAAAVTKVQGGTTTPVATQRQSSTPPQPLQQHTESDLAGPGEVEHPQDACGLCCTAMDVWTLWGQTAKPTTPPPLATPTALTPTVEIGGITNTHPPLAGRTPLQPSQPSRTRMLPPRNVESRDAPPDLMPALPPPRSSTSQPPPSRLPSHISFTVQTASNPCKNSHSAPDVGAIGGSTPAMASLRGTTATAVYERRLTSPPTPFPARCTQLQREREPAPISSTATPTTAVAAAATAATADLLQVLPSLLPIRGSITDTCSSPSPQPPTTLLRNTPPSLQRPPKQLCAFTAATPEFWASMRRAQKHDPVDAGQQERRERRAFTEARTTAGPAPAQQQQQATICTTQRSRIESLESFGGGSGDSADDAEGSRDDCKTRAAAQGSGSAYDSLCLATVLPQTHAQQRRGVQRVLGSTVKPLRRVVSATPAAERCRWETDFSGEVGSGSDSAARRTPNATGAAPSEKCRRAAQLPNVAQWMEQHDGVDATLVTQSLSRHRRPRGGLYSAASFVAVLSAAVARLLSHDFPATPSSLDPSTPASASCATASVAAQRLELIRCGRLLPTLATLESLNLLKRCVPVWCYTFDPITGCRTPSEHGDNIGGSSGHAHNQSYLQRYAPSLNRAVPGSRGGNSGGSGAGSGIHELGRASKAGLTATYRYMADTAKTVLDAVKSSAPNKAHDVMMGSDGDNTQPAGGGDARCPVFPGTPATTIPPPPKATPVVSPPIVVPPVHGSGNVTRDVTKDPSLYYAVCGLYITEQDIIIRAMPTVEVRRQRERAKLKRRQHQQQLHKGLSTAHTRFWSWAKSSGGGENYLGHSGTPLGDGEAERFRCADGNTSGGEGEGEGVDDDDDSDDEEVVELLVLPRVSLVSVTACAVDRSAGGVFSHKHAHKLHDHLEKQPNITPLYSPITTSSVPHMSSATAHLARRGVSFRGGNGSGGGGGDGHGEGDRGGGARRSNATTTSSPAAHTRHKLPRTSAIPREPGQTPFATMSTVVVLRLESVDMQTVWLEFTDEAVLNEVYQMLCATLASTTQPSGIADGPSRLSYTPLQQPLPCHGNRFLSSARRPWSMVPLVLLAAKVLPQGGATSPFIQAFLKNVTVAAVMLNAQGTVPSPATMAVRSPSLPSTQSSIISLPSSPPPHGLPTTLADTWWLYDPAREFARQGLPEEHWTLTRVNTDYAFCPTYPSAFVVPASVAHAMESGAMDGQHRMSRRVEAVAFYYAPTGGVLVRSAQPTLATLMTDVPTGPALEWTSRMTGGRLGKAAQDIPSLPPPPTTQPQPQPTTTTVPLRDVHCFTLNAFAAAAGVIAQQIFVMDLRSPRAAVGNAGKGGGTMDFLSYPFRGVEYAGLPNIHTVKKAWRRLRASLTHDAPLQLRGDDSGCLETQYVQHAGEPPYAAVVAAAELSLRAKRPASGIGVTRPQLASLLPRLHKRESRTLRHVRGGTSGAEGEAPIGYSDSEHVDGDDENENAGAGDDGAREGATSGTGAATSAPSRLPFSLGSVRWSAFFSAMTPAGGASVTAMMPAAQREWLAYLAMLLNTAVVAARRVCGVPTDPLYVPAMQHNGPSANCFSYIVGHAFSHFRLPKSSSSAALPQPPPPGSRRGLRTPATAGASAARSFKPPLASYEHDAHKTLAHVVFLNCSDGWDRTPQISVLVQLLLDPYYRTVEGLCILLERELLCFGHPTQLRSAAVRGNAANHTVQPVQDDRSVDVAVAASAAAAAAAKGIGTQVPMEARQLKDTVTAARSSPTHAVHASAESQSGATVESDRRSDSEVSQVSCDVAPQAATASVTGDDDHYGYDDGDASSVILLEEVEAEGFNAAAESKPKEKALYRWPQRARAALSRGGSASASAGDAGATWDREQRCSTPPAGAHAPSVSASMPAKPPAASPPPSSQSSNEAAPILAQLLDAIHQLVVLYPACFEYTPQFVCLLLDLLHSGMISTFSVNCEQHVGSQWVAEGTLSLSQWCALLLSTTTATPSTVSAPKPVMANPPRLSSPTVARSGGGGATTALIPITAHNPRATVAPELLRQRDPRSALALPLSPPSLPSSYADPVSELGGAEANVGAASSADTSFHRLDSTFLMCDAGMEEAEEEEEEEDGGKKDHDQKDSVEKTVDLSRCSSGEEGRGKAFALHRRRSGNVGASGKQPRRTVAVARLQASGCTLAAPPLGHGETVGKEEPAAVEGRSFTPPLPTLAPPDPCLGLYDFDYTTRWGVSLTSEAPPQPRSGHAPLTSFSGCSAATSPSTHSAQPHGEASRSGGSRQREHSQQQGGYNSNAAMVVDEFTRRLLPISYSALYYSNYLNPEFSLRHNRVDVGPLVDFILPYKLTLWRAAYARHSFWGARQAQLQHSTGQYQQQQQQQQQRPPQNSWRGSGGGIGHGVPNATGDLRDSVGRYGGGGNGCSADIATQAPPARLAFEAARWQPRSNSSGPSSSLADTSVTSRAAGGSGGTSVLPGEDKSECHVYGRPTPFADTSALCATPTPGIYQFHIGSSSEDEEEDHAGGEEEEEGEAGMLNGCGHTCQGART